MDCPAEGEYELAFVAFNTIFALTTQEAQVRCFASVAKHLKPGGSFVLEAFVPDQSRHARGQNVSAARVSVDEITLDLARHYAVRQLVVTQHLVIGPQGAKLYPVQLRYIWPSEMDLMAMLARLRLESRWGDWDRSAFTDASTKHVSVYRKP